MNLFIGFGHGDTLVFLQGRLDFERFFKDLIFLPARMTPVGRGFSIGLWTFRFSLGIGFGFVNWTLILDDWKTKIIGKSLIL